MTRVWAAADLAVAALVAAAIATMIGDQAVNGAFALDEYFAYFTIQTNLLDVVVLVVGGLALLRRGEQSPGYATVRACAVAYAVVTGVVYNALLRGLPAAPGDYVTQIGWPNEVVHVVGPAYLALEWVLHRSRPLPGRSLGSLVAVGVAYPVVWVVLTLVRGGLDGLDGWYPYDFLDPAQPAGVVGVAAHVVGIAAFIALLLVGTRLVRGRGRGSRMGA